MRAPVAWVLAYSSIYVGCSFSVQMLKKDNFLKTTGLILRAIEPILSLYSFDEFFKLNLKNVENVWREKVCEIMTCHFGSRPIVLNPLNCKCCVSFFIRHFVIIIAVLINSFVTFVFLNYRYWPLPSGCPWVRTQSRSWPFRRSKCPYVRFLQGIHPELRAATGRYRWHPISIW